MMVHIRKKRRLTAFDVCLVLFFGLLAFVCIFPFWNILMISLTPNKYYLQNGVVLFSSEFTLINYQYIFTSSQVLQALWTSVRVSVMFVLYSMFLTVLLAYALSVPQFPGKRLLITYVLFPMFFGGGLVPFYIQVRDLGLIESLWALILPYGINTFYLIVIKNSFTGIPSSLYEAARIDGANDIRIFCSVAFPLSLATIATFSLFMMVDKWNDWFSAMLFINDTNQYPLAKLLRDIVYNGKNIGDMSVMPGQSAEQLYAGTDGIKMATVVIAIVPIVCVYPFLQRYFVRGVMSGAIKS